MPRRARYPAGVRPLSRVSWVSLAMLGPVAAASRPIRSIVHSAYRRFELGMCSAMVMEGHDQGLAVLKKGGGVAKCRSNLKDGI